MGLANESTFYDGQRGAYAVNVDTENENLRKPSMVQVLLVGTILPGTPL